MQLVHLVNIAGITMGVLGLLSVAVWACRDWRQAKNRRQADKAIATLETAIRARPRWLADSRLPNRRARVREWGGRI